MIGITMDELKEKILGGHEAEFSYRGCEYSLETETANEMVTAKIWKCTNEPICIAETNIGEPYEFDKLLNEKCFEGKSFYEIEAEIIVENVF
jgi:hypothetical protein